MNEALEWTNHFVASIRTNRTFLVLVVCWCLGLFCKKCKLIPNDAIPWIVISVGAAFSFTIDNTHTPDLNLLQEKVIGLAVGFIISTGAWVSHRFVWKNISKLPIVGQYLDTGNSDPKAFVKGENAEHDPGLVQKIVLLDQTKRDKVNEPKPKDK